MNVNADAQANGGNDGLILVTAFLFIERHYVDFLVTTLLHYAMSVTLEKYCETSQSKFAEALKVALKDVVFVGSDDIEFEEVSDQVKARIQVMYSLSVFDVRHLLDAFSAFYWGIEPGNDVYEYYIVVYLKKGMV